MPNAESPSTAVMRTEGSGGLTILVAGLSAYLQEIEGFRAVCRRHEDTAAVDGKEGGLRVTRCFTIAPGIVEHLRCTTLTFGAPRSASDDLEGGWRRPCLLRREAVWEGRPILVRAFERSSPAIVHVELLVGQREDRVRELPLRALATALRCHEFLLPEGLAEPLPLPDSAQRAGHDIRAYLKRTMPQNLYASQCI